MSYLVLVRHGESFWNKEGLNCFTGWVDVANLPSGTKKLIKTGKLLENFPFHVAFTSELYRAIETTMIILSHNKVSGTPMVVSSRKKIAKWGKFYHKDFGKFVPIIKTFSLNERYYGKLQGMNKDKARKKFGEEKVFQWRRGYDINPPGGESLEEVMRRVVKFFNGNIEPQLRNKKNILIGAHGNSLRALVMFLDKLSPEQVSKLNIKKGVPLVYRYIRGTTQKIGYINNKKQLSLLK